jgi:thioredoxin-related protein
VKQAVGNAEASMRQLLLVLIGFLVLSANAAIPDDYTPVVVEAPFSLRERVFDLMPAIESSRKTGKPLFIYLGAKDCPPCLQYKKFLASHRSELKEAFSELVVVDIRTWLRGPTMYVKFDDKRLTFNQFKTLVGDTSKNLVFPSFWLLSPELKQIKELPSGVKDFLSVDQHLEILKISTR